MFEILRNNKKLLAVHIIAAVIVVGAIVAVGIWIGKINHVKTECVDWLQTCQNNSLSANNEKNELASSVESLTDEINEKKREIDEVKNNSLYTCLGAYENIPVLSEDLQNSTDTYKKADYIVKNNLYVVACNKLWHGEKNLSGTSTISHGKYVDETEWFRYKTGSKLYIVLHDMGGPGVSGYFAIDTEKNTQDYVTTDFFSDKCNAFNSFYSPNNKYCLSGNQNDDGRTIKIYDWLNEKQIKSITLNLAENETANFCMTSCLPPGEGECDVAYDYNWVSEGNVEIGVYQISTPDANGNNFGSCILLRNIQIKI